MDNQVLRAIVEKNSGNTIKDYPDELNVSLKTISRHLKLIAKDKKIDKLVLYESNENCTRKHPSS